MPSPWDDNNVKANLVIIAQLQANQRLKTSERGRVLARFSLFTKTIFNKEPAMDTAKFKRPLIEVFKRGAVLATRQRIFTEGSSTTDDFESDTKIEKDDLQGAFSGLLVLADIYRRAKNRQRYAAVKSVITDVTKALRKIGDKDRVFRGGVE